MADSRYVTRDSFVINMEAVTAFAVGPMCFWAVAGMVQRKPWRHILQLVLSVCQLYGDVLYFATTGTEGAPLGKTQFLSIVFAGSTVNTGSWPAFISTAAQETQSALWDRSRSMHIQRRL